jgi:hypothetical protein
MASNNPKLIMMIMCPVESSVIAASCGSRFAGKPASKGMYILKGCRVGAIRSLQLYAKITTVAQQCASHDLRSVCV